MAYHPKTKYTPEELRRAEIQDLEADLAFSLREDPDTPEWVSYRESVQSRLNRLRSEATERS